MGNSTATSRVRCPGPTKNGTWWSLPSAVSRKAYTPLAMVLGDVEGEGSRPVGVGDVVVMEVDGVVLVRGLPEVLDAALESWAR